MKKKIIMIISALCVANLLSGCANTAEIVLPNGETSTIELKEDGKVINPFEYYDIVFSGYNGYGTAQAVQKEDNQFEISFDKKDHLSNGDTITASASSIPSMGNDVMSPSVMEFEVTGLDELQALDPFEGLEVQFDGILPDITVSFNTANCNQAIKDNIDFLVIDSNILLEGDSFITVRAHQSNTSAEDNLTQLGYCIPVYEKDYIVESDSKYITSVEDADFTQLDKDMFDCVESWANSDIGRYSILNIHLSECAGDGWGIVRSISNIEKNSSYIMTLKNSSAISDNNPYNKYYTTYKVDFSWENEFDKNKNGSSSVYCVVCIDNITVNKDGKMLYNIGHEFNPDTMIYSNAEATQEALNSKYIVSEKGNYNVTEIK